MQKNEMPPIPFRDLKIVLRPLDFSSENWTWNRRMEACFKVWVALEGFAELETKGKVYEVHPGTAFIFSPHQKISAKSLNEGIFRNFSCRFLPRGEHSQVLTAKIDQLMGVRTSDLARIKMLCRAAIQAANYHDALADQQAAGLCYQILAHIWRDAHTPPSPDTDTAIMRLIERLKDQPSQRMSLEEMAREARLSVSQFSRRFTAIAGESPMKFAIGQRILRAQLLLRGSSSNINEIADSLGYEDVYFFSRQFKQVTNMTPSQYRHKADI